MQTKARRIAREDRLEISDHLDQDHRREMMDLVAQGLTAERKWLHCKYLYDERGSKLFERICQTPEYYPTRAEMGILERHGREMMEFFELRGGDLVELGSGGNRKVRLLLDHLSPRARSHLRYVPLDISRSALEAAARELLDLYPELTVLGLVADFTRHLDLVPKGRKLLVFFGSSLGNFSEQASREFLGAVAAAMGRQDRFLLGLDMLKPVEIIEAAYNDAQGVTRQFTKNILANLNRELGADFDLEDFEHQAFFNPTRECMEMHLVARRPLTCRIADLDLEVSFAAGETIHAEIAQKYSPARAEALFRQAGLTPIRWFSDEQGWFSLVELARSE